MLGLKMNMNRMNSWQSFSESRVLAKFSRAFSYRSSESESCKSLSLFRIDGCCSFVPTNSGVSLHGTGNHLFPIFVLLMPLELPLHNFCFLQPWVFTIKINKIIKWWGSSHKKTNCSFITGYFVLLHVFNEAATYVPHYAWLCNDWSDALSEGRKTVHL